MLPFVNVSHLASSTSFYSAILQPLGLGYIGVSQPDGPSLIAVALNLHSQSGPPRTSVDFGQHLPAPPHNPVIQLREAAKSSPSAPLKLSHIVFTAPSPKAVAEFRSCALRATSYTPPFACDNPLQPLVPDSNGEIRAQITDLDGNTMSVVYQPPAQYPTRRDGSTVRRTQSTTDEVSRILHWNYDVARSSPGGSSPRPASHEPRYLEGKDPFPLRRSVTAPAYESSPRRNSSGVSAGVVAGLVATGAAVGAALTYSSMRSDRARAPVQEYDPPAFQRRSTLPDRLASLARPKAVEVERTVERMHYPEDRPPFASHRPPPQYLARYSQAGATRSREADDLYEPRSRHSNHPLGRNSSVRTRSETPSHRAPLLLTDYEHRSQATAKQSAASNPVYRPVIGIDGASYTSARSHRSSSTVRPPAPPPAPSDHYRARVSSRAPSAAVRSSGGPHAHVPPNSSRTATMVSARKIPLPPPGTGSSYTVYDDGNDSVAPDDSISCVGSRGSRRRVY